MIGTKFAKPLTDLSGYSQAAKWCNENSAHIEEFNDYYEVVENIPYEPSKKEIKQNRISELKKNLFDTDYIAAKIAEGSASKEEYAEQILQREEWRKEIRQLLEDE